MTKVQILFWLIIPIIGNSQPSFDEQIDKINDIDRRLVEADFRQVSYTEKDVRTEIKAYFLNGELVKIVTKSAVNEEKTERSYYLIKAKLMGLREHILFDPRMPKWERAKSNSLGMEEVQRSDAKAVTIKQYFFSDELGFEKEGMEFVRIKGELIEEIMNRLDLALSALN